jgi:hypothetical protein
LSQDIKNIFDFIKIGLFEVKMMKICLQKQLWQPKMQTFFCLYIGLFKMCKLTILTLWEKYCPFNVKKLVPKLQTFFGISNCFVWLKDIYIKISKITLSLALLKKNNVDFSKKKPVFRPKTLVDKTKTTVSAKVASLYLDFCFLS